MGGDVMAASESAVAVIACIRSGDMQSAVRLAAELPLDNLNDAILGEAFDHQSLACYGLYVALLLDEESAARHVAASELLSLALNIFPGAYGMAFFHAVRAVALAPDDVSYKEHLLSFHNNPERLLSPEEAHRVAQEVLDLDPSNDAGQEVLRATDRQKG
jgi:tetratricopeptide (TPR) repeat protein